MAKKESVEKTVRNIRQKPPETSHTRWKTFAPLQTQVEGREIVRLAAKLPPYSRSS